MSSKLNSTHVVELGILSTIVNDRYNDITTRVPTPIELPSKHLISQTRITHLPIHLKLNEDSWFFDLHPFGNTQSPVVNVKKRLGASFWEKSDLDTPIDNSFLVDNAQIHDLSSNIFKGNIANKGNNFFNDNHKSNDLFHVEPSDDTIDDILSNNLIHKKKKVLIAISHPKERRPNNIMSKATNNSRKAFQYNNKTNANKEYDLKGNILYNNDNSRKSMNLKEMQDDTPALTTSFDTDISLILFPTY